MASMMDEFFLAERALVEELTRLCEDCELPVDEAGQYIFFGKMQGHCLFWIRQCKNGFFFVARRTLSLDRGDNILRLPFRDEHRATILEAAKSILAQAREVLQNTGGAASAEAWAESAAPKAPTWQASREEVPPPAAHDNRDGSPFDYTENDPQSDLLRATMGMLEEHVRLHGDFPLVCRGKRLRYIGILLSRYGVHTASDLLAYGAENLITTHGAGEKRLYRLAKYLERVMSDYGRSTEEKAGRTADAEAYGEEKKESELTRAVRAVAEALEADDFPDANAERRAQLSAASAQFYVILTALAEQLRAKCSDELQKGPSRRPRSILIFLEYASSDKSFAKMGRELGVSRARVGQLVAHGRQAALLTLKGAYHRKEEPFFSLLDECIALLSGVAYDVVHLVEYNSVARSRRTRTELCHLLFGSMLVQKIDGRVRR